jgi:GNAT superfamily N-acetyltransferase
MIRAAPASLGLSVEASDAFVALFAPAFDIVLFNRTIGLGVRVPASRDSVDALIAKYRAAGVTRFGIQLSPAARPSDVSEWLTAHDLHVSDYWTKVYMPPDAARAVETDLRITRIDASLADRFSDVACTSFGMPPALCPFIGATIGKTGWHHYIAWDGPEAAAVGALFVHGEVGWLGIGATLPAYRRRGAQGALMTRRIADGAALGCRWFASETGQDLPDKPNPSFHNMLRTGFKVAYHRPNYMQEIE